MRTDQLRDAYLRWLEPQLKDENEDGNKTFHELCDLMFETEFGWVLPLDANRIADGTDLRVEFARENRLRPDILADLWPCSFLEVLIGLSRRLAHSAGGKAPGWACELLNNLEMHRMSDPLTRYKRRKAQEIMDAAIRRQYNPDGTGGFFPLAFPDDDQTQVELWYQMHSFIEELHPEHRPWPT